MATVTIELPSLLETIVGVREFCVNASTVGDALTQAAVRYPALGLHLFDEAGDLRRHVVCYHNAYSTRWSDDGMLRPLAPGDTLIILQAVSGG